MKNLTSKLTIAAVALVAAGAASAQVMKADIPFAFQAGGKVMAAGTYRVDLHGLGGSVVIQDANWHSSVMAMPVARIDGRDGDSNGDAKLIFTCRHGVYTLAQAWPGTSGTGLKFYTPKTKRDEEATLSVIRLRPDAAE